MILLGCIKYGSTYREVGVGPAIKVRGKEKEREREMLLPFEKRTTDHLFLGLNAFLRVDSCGVAFDNWSLNVHDIWEISER